MTPHPGRHAVDAVKPAEWHQLDAASVAARLATDPGRGLSAAEAASRLAQAGANELLDRGARSALRILADQLTGTLVLLLIAAAAVSTAIGELKDGITIAAIVVLNSLLGFYQEYRAEHAIGALKRLAVPRVHVRRDGVLQEICARELVPGDILLLEAGNVVAADARVIEAVHLRAQEAALTGESDSVEKHVDPVGGSQVPIGDRRSMVYMGTSIGWGRGTAVVTATGMATELGAIAATLQQLRREPTPLQRRLDRLGRDLALAALAIVCVIFTLGMLRGEPLQIMLLTAVSMAVAAVPEGLPAVVTIALAIGAQRMLRRQALIRTLTAVETLGSVTVICSDKTGTLTENRMRAVTAVIGGRTATLDGEEAPDLAAWIARWSAAGQAAGTADREPELAMAVMLAGGALCNDASLQSPAAGASAAEMRAAGDPTEVALVEAAARRGLHKPDLERRFPRVAEVPFDSERKRMTTVHTLAGAWLPLEQVLHRAWSESGGAGEPLHVAFTKGAVDRLIESCTQIWLDGTAAGMTESHRRDILAAQDALAGDGLRILGVAFRPLGHQPPLETVERDLIFVGMVGIVDPPRAEARQAVQTCASAGIRPLMITGDHPLTAAHVARRLGMPDADRIVTGTDLDRLSDSELIETVEKVSVFARVSPAHKHRIVQLLQRRGHVVAMTGDGVNDAPALKAADIGVAMGITGTDVSKEAADAVLLDDNFATIVAAVEEGRIIYDNIRKFVKYLLTTNSAELWVMLVAPLAGMPLPLLPLQILWINLVTDGPTALTLGVEPAECGVMQRPPRPATESIFAGGLGWHVLWVGVLMAGLTMGVGYWYWSSGDPRWQTVVFTTLALSQMAHVLAIRTGNASLFRIGVLSNPLLAAAVATTIILQLMLIYVPSLAGVFSTVPLTAVDLAVCGGVGVVVFAAVEGEKRFPRPAATASERRES